MTLPNPQRHVVPTAVVTKSKLVPITTARLVTAVVPKTNVTRPRHAKFVVTKPLSPPRRHINRSPSPKASTFLLKVTTAKAPMVNVVKGNTDRDATFEEKEPEFEGRKPEFKVHVSPSSKFKDFFDNSINEVNDASNLVPAVGQIFTASTNTFSVVGPSNAVVSPTYGKSSYMDASQLPDDPNMLELEDITYSNDE
nr:hypothetical protein [Tanacetum cinerariifolium]